MAYSPLICPYCKKVIGKFHRGEHRQIITEHFKTEHKKEYEEIKDAYKIYNDLSNKYSYEGY